jgi:hypothetical protein
MEKETTKARNILISKTQDLLFIVERQRLGIGSMTGIVEKYVTK